MIKDMMDDQKVEVLKHYAAVEVFHQRGARVTGTQSADLLSAGRVRGC